MKANNPLTLENIMTFYLNSLTPIENSEEIRQLVEVLEGVSPEMVQASIEVAYQRKNNEEVEAVTSKNPYRDSDDTFVLTIEVRVRKYNTQEYRLLSPFVESAIAGANEKLRLAREAEMAALLARRDTLEAEIASLKAS